VGPAAGACFSMGHSVFSPFSAFGVTASDGAGGGLAIFTPVVRHLAVSQAAHRASGRAKGVKRKQEPTKHLQGACTSGLGRFGYSSAQPSSTAWVCAIWLQGQLPFGTVGLVVAVGLFDRDLSSG